MTERRKSYYLKHPRSAYYEFVYWPIKNRWQLLRRGWANSDIWGLDNVLCRRLGAQLLYLADHDHGWPDQEFETPEEWSAALRENGQALLDYTQKPGYTELLMKWHDLKFGSGKSDWIAQINAPDDEATAAASEEMMALEERYYEGGQNALHWVADHLGNLWD